MMEKAQRIIEVERVVNLVKGFGWELDATHEEETELRITIRKTVTPPAPAA